jgi:acyl-CoA dehydrogenase
MDFSLGSEEETLRLEVQKFVSEELMPLEHLFDHAPEIFIGNRWKTRAKLSVDPEIQRYVAIMEGLERKAQDRGFWELDVPRAFGGRKITNVGMIAVTEELERSSVPFELGNHVSNILYACKNEQIERFLLPCIRGEKTSCFALTEPGAGSDPSMLAMTATPDGDDFILNGAKVFPTFADTADFSLVFARLPGTRGHEGVTCFLVEKDTPGFRIPRSIATIAGSDPCEIVIDNCRVHKSRVLGEVGKGWSLNQAWLGSRRFLVGIRCYGFARRLLRLVAKSLRNNPEQTAKFSGNFGALVAELSSVRLLTYFGSWKADEGLDVRAEASSVKLLGTELLDKVVDFALEVLGPDAYANNHPVARMFRQARVWRIVEGASELQRHVIQRSLFRDGTAWLELI